MWSRRLSGMGSRRGGRRSTEPRGGRRTPLVRPTAGSKISPPARLAPFRPGRVPGADIPPMPTPEPYPAVNVLRGPGLTVATLTGCPRLTAATAPAVRAALAPLADEAGEVHLDLATVEYMSSAGLVELVRLHR